MVIRPLSLVLAAALLTACAVGPQHVRPNLDLPQRFAGDTTIAAQGVPDVEGATDEPQATDAAQVANAAGAAHARIGCLASQSWHGVGNGSDHRL